jgi:putative Mg2+ transporter-C (MgtC) family protein|tara:strand:+ start:27146 stop:27631 length:486 start_codon:yes stop_codon:yes gene_type:complete
MINEYLGLTTLSHGELIFRVFMAILFSLILGLDRESKGKPMDFRAYIIVCVTTCLVSILALELSANHNNSEFLTMDLSRVIAGTLTAIGFLGTGAIITKDNDQVIGTATGASIWAAGGFGLSIGFGMYFIAIIGFLSVAAILVLGGMFMERSMGRKDSNNI